MTPDDADKPLTYPEELQASIDTYRNLAHQSLDHAAFASGIRYALDRWTEMRDGEHAECRRNLDRQPLPIPPAVRAQCGRHDCYHCAMEDL